MPSESRRAIWNHLVGEAWVRHADLQGEPFGNAVVGARGEVIGASVLVVGCGTDAAALGE